MGNCLSGSSSRANGEIGGAKVDNSLQVVGVQNPVGILGGINEGVANDTNPIHHIQNHHVRNPNSLPPLPDSDSNSQV